MKISGTYLDRVLYFALPYTIIPIIMGIYLGFTIIEIVLFIIGIIVIFGGLSIIFAYFEKFDTLTMTDTLFFNETEVTPSSIIQIRRDDFVQGRLRISAIEFTVDEKGKRVSYRIMAIPLTFFSKQSKTLDLLFAKFPFLKEKLIK